MEFEVDGILYDVNKDGKSVTVKEYTNTDVSCSELVTIPTKVTFNGMTYDVTSIGDHAFEGCSGLTSISIPESVKSIGDFAFWECKKLISIKIPDSLSKIGGGTFAFTAWYDNMPDGEVYIGNVLYAYKHEDYYNETITNLKIKDGTLGITANFSSLHILESITIPESVRYIVDNLFNGCSRLNSVIVEKNNPYYDSRENCNAIIETQTNKLIAGCNSTIIPNSVTSIGDYAFCGCYDREYINIPNSITHISEHSFHLCNLKEITIDCQKIDKWFCGMESIRFINFGEHVQIIGEHAFEGCTGLEEIRIPDNIVSIEDGAFARCNNVGYIKIPNSVKNIGRGFFYGNNLDIVDLDCETIYDWCYGRIPSVVRLGNNVKCIGKNAFERYSFKSIIPSSMSAENDAINSLLNKSIFIPPSVTSIEDNAFYGCSELTSIHIPSNVKYIGKNAFSDCTNLTSVTLPHNLTTISDGLFSGCISLKKIILPDSIKDIGNFAFGNCKKLNEVLIFDGVINIGDDAFYGCKSLKEITIPESVTNIGKGAFLYCNCDDDIEEEDDVDEKYEYNGYDYYENTESIYDNPYYNDDLDIDQQSPEFWNEY